MKTKNNLLKGIIIGICVIVLPLILMSTTSTTEKQNKFEIHVQSNQVGSTGTGVTVKLRGFLLNTETGETWFLENDEKTKH